MDTTLHLEESDGPMLYSEDTLSDVLPGTKETAVAVFEVSEVLCKLPENRTLAYVFGCFEESLALRIVSDSVTRCP